MQGHKSCVIAHIRQEVPEVIPMHCIAHKLELAILDSVKSIPFLKKYDETIKGIFILYHNSPKGMRGLDAVAGAMEVDICRFSDLKNVFVYMRSQLMI